jgi:hypothetical protein
MDETLVYSTLPRIMVVPHVLLAFRENKEKRSRLVPQLHRSGLHVDQIKKFNNLPKNVVGGVSA